MCHKKQPSIERYSCNLKPYEELQNSKHRRYSEIAKLTLEIRNLNFKPYARDLDEIIIKAQTRTNKICVSNCTIICEYEKQYNYMQNQHLILNEEYAFAGIYTHLNTKGISISSPVTKHMTFDLKLRTYNVIQVLISKCRQS